jgi:hypothetical protein
MHSSERAAGAAIAVSRLVIVAGLIAAACSPVPVASQPVGTTSPVCTAAANTPPKDAGALAALRRSIETGPFYTLAFPAGVASCLVTGDADVIRLEYMFRDGASLRVTRNPSIEYTDQELRLAAPLGERATAVLTRAEQAAFGAKGCGIDWRTPETGPAADDPRSTESVYRGDLCNCQARARSDGSGRVVRLQLRSAC